LLDLIANNLLDGEWISDNVWLPILNIFMSIFLSKSLYTTNIVAPAHNARAKRKVFYYCLNQGAYGF